MTIRQNGTSQNDASASATRGRSSPAFLLAQIGAHAAARFRERLAPLKLAPQHAGILRIIEASPGITQQTLANALGMLPSRLVALLDELESRGLMERRENRNDRRMYALHLTEQGRITLRKIGSASREHQENLLAALDETERRQLANLLQRVADQQGLTPGVHPGYARLGESETGQKE